MTAMELPKALRSHFRFVGDLVRAGEVARVLVKYGLAAWLTDVEWESLHNALKSQEGEILSDQPFEARMRLALTDLGTTFIKLGQLLSTRPHLVGDALAAELSKLQENTPPDNPEVARRTVETELGRPIEECFKRFDAVASASASVGEVHRASLKSGRRAIVKVQHPGIEGVVRRDLDILGFLAELAEKNEHMRRYQPVALIREFSRTTLNELDFRRELRNLQVFRRNFAEDQTVVFPKPYPELTSGRVLTMQFIKGCRVSDSKGLEKIDVAPQQLAERGANIFIEMIFRDGFYHADPHPGNLLVLPDGKIGILDAGMVGRIDERFRHQIEEILLAAGDRDAQRLVDAVTDICGTPRGLDRGALSTDLTEFFEEYGTQAVGQFDVSGALTGVAGILHEHQLVLPGKLSMLIKCLIILEGTGRLLSPSFNLAELLRPWRQTIVRRRFSPKAQLRNLRRIYTDWEKMLELAPKAVLAIIDQFEKGSFAVRLEHRHLKSAVNRLVVGLFISSLLVASAMLITRNIPPLAWGLSVFGILGYGIAILFGFRMLWVNRDKRVSKHEDEWE
jgi:ubiquinone biosynthesis protein